MEHLKIHFWTHPSNPLYVSGYFVEVIKPGKTTELIDEYRKLNIVPPLHFLQARDKVLSTGVELYERHTGHMPPKNCIFISTMPSPESIGDCPCRTPEELFNEWWINRGQILGNKDIARSAWLAAFDAMG